MAESRGEKVVVHFLDGEILKGYAKNFYEDAHGFLLDIHRGNNTRVFVSFAGVKAVFFVKSFSGEEGRVERYYLTREGFVKKKPPK